MNPIFSQAAALHPCQDGYTLAYGSHATGTHGPRSDLDLLYVGGPTLPAKQTTRLTADVKDLHLRHSLDLDEEVPYPIKLYVTGRQAEQAANLEGFPARPRPLPTQRTTTALATDTFRLRLAFNVLTTPHVFLIGDVTTYRRHIIRAERSAALLALAFSAPQAITVDQAIAALWRSPDGAQGKDFLGYLHAPHLRSVLGRGFAELAAARLARRDGGRWQQTASSTPAGS
ncbi:hypothetical protein [Streptomyces sp. NPDC058268]|uniref:hypothetical protein n=1 Tax=Streptomyces sp. NPDC058268 TaxID=3346413 RepID=UPI0036EEEB3D